MNFPLNIVLTPDTTTTFVDVSFTTLSVWAQLSESSLFPYPHHHYQIACEQCSFIHGCPTVFALLVYFAVWSAIYRLLLLLRVIYPFFACYMCWKYFSLSWDFVDDGATIRGNWRKHNFVGDINISLSLFTRLKKNRVNAVDVGNVYLFMQQTFMQHLLHASHYWDKLVDNQTHVINNNHSHNNRPGLEELAF